MRQTKKFQHAILDELSASMLEMPYTGDRLSLQLVLPRRGNNLDALEQKLRTADLQKLFDSNRGEEKVAVTLPRFKLGQTIPLTDQLQQIGMTDMFVGRKADFSRISRSFPQRSYTLTHIRFLSLSYIHTHTGRLIHIYTHPLSLSLLHTHTHTHRHSYTFTHIHPPCLFLYISVYLYSYAPPSLLISLFLSISSYLSVYLTLSHTHTLLYISIPTFSLSICFSHAQAVGYFPNY